LVDIVYDDETGW